jgi:hypothetical protein
MGAALRVSRNNPAPNTKMVARRMAAGTLCIQVLDVIGEIAPSTAGAGWLLRGSRINARLRYLAAGKFCIRKKQSSGSAPNSKVPLAGQEKAPARYCWG